jgi:hypothetical protein
VPCSSSWQSPGLLWPRRDGTTFSGQCTCIHLSNLIDENMGSCNHNDIFFEQYFNAIFQEIIVRFLTLPSEKRLRKKENAILLKFHGFGGVFLEFRMVDTA